MLVALSLVTGMPGATHATESEGSCSDWGQSDFWRLNALAEVQRCLAGGEAVNFRNEWGTTPLHFAASSQPAATVKLLLAEGAQVGVRNDLGAHPLHYGVAEAGDRSTDTYYTSVFLLRRDGHAVGSFPPLFYPDYTEVVSVLVAAGAQVDARAEDGRTPLHVAAVQRSEATIGVLLAAGAELEARDAEGRTPLHFAAGRVMVRVRDEDGSIALNYDDRFRYHDVNSLQALLAGGADPEARDAEGRTPLHYALEIGYAKGARVLLDAGADGTARTVDGKTPFDLAEGLRGTDAYRRLGDALSP